jgi:hypothetical protein
VASRPDGIHTAGELVYAGAGTSGNNITFTAGSTHGVSMIIAGQITDATNGAGFTEYVTSSAAGQQASSVTLSADGTGGIDGTQATFRAAGPVSITATDILTPTVTGAQSGIVVEP